MTTYQAKMRPIHRIVKPRRAGLGWSVKIERFVLGRTDWKGFHTGDHWEGADWAWGWTIERAYRRASKRIARWHAKDEEERRLDGLLPPVPLDQRGRPDLRTGMEP